MNVPQDYIDRMLAGGELGIQTSIVSLAAVTAIRRGTPIEKLKLRDCPPEAAAALTAAVHHCYEEWIKDKPTEIELDCAIALYKEHLVQAGYTIEEGFYN